MWSKLYSTLVLVKNSNKNIIKSILTNGENKRKNG